MSLLRVELLKRMDKNVAEAIENFRQSEEFELTAVLWSRSTLVSVFKRVSRDILKFDSQFPLDQLPFMKDCRRSRLGRQRRRKRQNTRGRRAEATPPRETFLIPRLKVHLHLLLQKTRYLVSLLLPWVRFHS